MPRRTDLSSMVRAVFLVSSFVAVAAIGLPLVRTRGAHRKLFSY
jgi:hypothetical protein